MKMDLTTLTVTVTSLRCGFKMNLAVKKLTRKIPDFLHVLGESIHLEAVRVLEKRASIMMMMVASTRTALVVMIQIETGLLTGNQSGFNMVLPIILLVFQRQGPSESFYSTTQMLLQPKVTTTQAE